MRVPAVMAGIGCLLLVHGLVAVRGQSSLADLDIEFTEAKMTLQSVAEDNAHLRKRLALLEETVKALTESLAAANSDVEVFRLEGAELRLRLEALGVDGAAPDEKKLQQRLLKAVSDLRLAQTERNTLREQLLALNEALVTFLKGVEGSDPDARLAVEAQLRETNLALGGAPAGAAEAEAIPATLTDAMVISVKEELSLVVMNVGGRNGVKMGMPFKVMRGDSVIGLVRVVDVRERIAGAVIQDLGSDKERIKLGDHLRVDARQ